MANVVIRPGERWELEHLMAGIDPGNTVVLADEAIELMTACQAADLKAGLVLSPAVWGAQERYRTRVPRLTDDRVLAGDLVAEETAAAGAREEAGR